MIYNLKNEFECQRFKDAVARMIAEGTVVDMRRKRPVRSLSQNSYLHVLLGYYAAEFGYTIEEVKFETFKKTCNASLFVRERENRRGCRVRYIRSSRDLTTDEMTLAIERFRNYSASVAGLYLPEPRESEALLFAEQQIELCKEYL